MADRELSERLQATGAVLIEGARACGKTATARHQAGSEVLIDTDPEARRAIAIDPALILDGATPRLIDEWQVEPAIWNHVRRAVDDRREPGQFILTGSAVPADDATRHTGAGRIGRMRMRPMSLAECGVSDGRTSLRSLLAGEPPAPHGKYELELGTLLELISRGGWPGLQAIDLPAAQQALRDYIEDTTRVDLARVATVRHDPVNVGRLLRGIARNVATEAPATVLAADAGGSDGPLDSDTVRSYLAALARIYVTEDLPAWSTHLRSRHTLRKAPKRHFVDPSIAVAALGGGPTSLRRDLRLTGLLFESLVIRDLRIYAQPDWGRIFHYRDSSGLEVDVIVEAGDGSWGAFEVKLGASRVDEAAQNLRRFRERVDTDRRGEPTFLGVICDRGYAYVREDGIQVIPIGALGP